MTELVILVDEKDNQIGTGEKLDTHRKAILHRGFSVFLFNKKGETLLQRRALTKYHGAGKWGNAVCGHPRPNEELTAAMKRRLKEEIGVEVNQLEKMFDYIYKVKLEKDMNEHEFLHVYKAEFNGVPKLNQEEADDWKWISIKDLKEDIKNNPEKYASWFKLSMTRL